MASVLDITTGGPADLRESQTTGELARSVSELAVEQIGQKDDVIWLTGKYWELLAEQQTLKKALADALMRLGEAAVVVRDLRERVGALEGRAADG